MQLDQVHGRHRESRTVDHAGDVAIQGDVIQAVGFGGRFGRVFLRAVAEFGQFRLAKQRVVVDVDLRIQGNQLPVRGDHQRVDLDEPRVTLIEHAKQSSEQFAERRRGRFFQPQRERKPARLIRQHAGGHRNANRENALRMLGRDGLDVHAAIATGDKHDAFTRAVHQGTQVKLACNCRGAFDQKAVNRQTRTVGLMGGQCAAEQLIAGLAQLIDGIDQTNTAGLAAAARVNLCLHDPARTAERAGRRDGRVCRVDDHAVRNADPVVRKQTLGLVFVQLHGDLSAGSGAQCYYFSWHVSP